MLSLQHRAEAVDRRDRFAHSLLLLCLALRKLQKCGRAAAPPSADEQCVKQKVLMEGRKYIQCSSTSYMSCRSIALLRMLDVAMYELNDTGSS